MRAALRSQVRPADARLAFHQADPCTGANWAPPRAKQHGKRAIEASRQVGLFAPTDQPAHRSDVRHRCVLGRGLRQLARPRGHANSRQGAKP
jgi:hypothetical protein